MTGVEGWGVEAHPLLLSQPLFSYIHPIDDLEIHRCLTIMKFYALTSYIYSSSISSVFLSMLCEPSVLVHNYSFISRVGLPVSDNLCIPAGWCTAEHKGKPDKVTN